MYPGVRIPMDVKLYLILRLLTTAISPYRAIWSSLFPPVNTYPQNYNRLCFNRNVGEYGNKVGYYRA